MDITHNIYSGFLDTLFNFFHTVFPALAAHWGRFLTVVMTLVIIFLAWKIMRGDFLEKTDAVISGVVIFCVIFQITVIQSGLYMHWVSNLFFRSFQDISGWFVNFVTDGDVSGISGLFQALDGMFMEIIGIVEKIQPVGWKVWNYIVGAIAITLLLGSYTCVYLSFFCIMLLAIFALHIYFLVGGIFLFFLVLKNTRHLFWAWFRAVMNQGMVMIFAAIVMSMCFFGIDEASKTFVATADVSKGFFRLEYAMIIAWCVVCFIMLLKVPDLAAALSGGMAGSTMEIARTVSMIGGGVMAATGFAGRKAGIGLGRLGRQAYHNFTESRPYSRMMGLKK